MEDSQYPFPASATDDENRRHNNLRRDILTSLLEVDQSIKGLEHHLVGRIQQIEDRLHQPEAGTTQQESSQRCEFDPAATTEWALKILQDNLSPFTSSLSAIQSALKALPGKGSPEGLIEYLQEELDPLREMLLSLKGETEKVRDSVTELRNGSPSAQADMAPLQEMLAHLKEDTGQVR